MSFNNFGLSEPILKAIQQKGYVHPTAVQQQTIPHIIEGSDILGSAATGTGKTAAFCIPLLHNLMNKKAHGNNVRALILTPTRELAIQVLDNLRSYGKYLPLKSTGIFGGVSQFGQEKELSRGIDIVVATPGRLLDLVTQKKLSLAAIETLVLDEADRMLDMGFIHDIKRILKVIPAKRQNMFFSATLPAEAKSLAATMLRNPKTISVETAKTEAQIAESVYFVARESKRALLKHVISEKEMKTVIVFTRTKHGADRIAKDLNKSGITAEALHGDKSQNARQRALLNFKKNSTRVLVATDIAARGIDIADLPYVINFELPESAETYRHRIGRTGRAGKSGIALSFCDSEEKGQLHNINRTADKRLVVESHPFG